MEFILIALLAGGGTFLYLHEPAPVALNPGAEKLALVRKFEPNPENPLQDRPVLSAAYKAFDERVKRGECEQRMNGDITGDWLDYNFATKSKALDWYEANARNTASRTPGVTDVTYEFSVETERGFLYFGFECP